MAMKGRKPKPTSIKKLEGNPGKRPFNANEPKPNKPHRNVPTGLLPDAQDEWKRLAASLEKPRPA